MREKKEKRRVMYAVMLIIMIPMLLCMTNPVQAKAAKMKLNVSKKTIVIGSTYKLKVQNTSKKVKWSSSNKKVATVTSGGKVTAKKAGTTTITAKVGKKKMECTIKVITKQTSYRNKLIKLINKDRRRYGFSSFDKNSVLHAAAQKRAKELSKKFSHKRPNGDKWTSAISMKYDFKRAAENIACDFAKPEQVVDAWMDKASTKAKIISKQYDEIGVGVYLAPDGYLYWCAIFAKEK